MNRISSLALLASCAGFVLAPLAVAQTAPSEDVESRQDTVIVVGTRQAYQGEFEPLETPQNDLKITADVLQASGALDLSSALDLSASMSRQNNFGGLWNSFAVRGFVGDENLPSNYLVNGFNAGRGFGGPRDLSGIESVDILKGPRAALFGRGEPGGTINLVTKRPTFETAVEIRVSAGSFDTYRVDADWTAPVSDRFAIRLVGFGSDSGSFRDTIETEKYGISPSLAFRLSDQTQLVYELEASVQKIPFDRGVPAIGGVLGRVPESRFLGEPGDGPIEANTLGHQIEFQHSFNEDWSALIGYNYRETSLQGNSTEAELVASRQRLFVDGQSLSRQRRYRDYDATYNVLRAEISGRFNTAGLEHSVLIGADMDEFENDQVFLRFRPPTNASNPSAQAANIINVFNPVYGRFPLPGFAPQTNRVETQQSSGFYFQDQIALSDYIEVRIGGRYDDYQQDLLNRANGAQTRQTDSRFSPQYGVVLKISDSVSLYATRGENFRPLSGTDFSGRAFEPNDSVSSEAGAKLLLRDGQLSAAFSIFSVEQDNILVADPVNAGFSIAGGKAESQGFEVDVAGALTDTLDIWLSYAYVDASMRNGVLDPNFALPIRAGDRLLNIPEQSFNLQLARDFSLNNKTLQIGGGVLYVGERLGEVATSFELPEYTLARAFAAYDLNEALTLRAEVDNLFDETYYTNSFSQLWVQPGAPQSFRVSAALKF